MFRGMRGPDDIISEPPALDEVARKTGGTFCGTVGRTTEYTIEGPPIPGGNMEVGVTGSDYMQKKRRE
jgi:hypothetical protein